MLSNEVQPLTVKFTIGLKEIGFNVPPELAPEILRSFKLVKLFRFSEVASLTNISMDWRFVKCSKPVKLATVDTPPTK